MPKRQSMSVLFARYAREAPVGEVTLVLDIVKDILRERENFTAEAQAMIAPPKPAAAKKRGRKPGSTNKPKVKAEAKVEESDAPAADEPDDESAARPTPVPPTPRTPRLPRAPVASGPPPFRGGMPSGAMPPLGGGSGS